MGLGLSRRRSLFAQQPSLAAGGALSATGDTITLSSTGATVVDAGGDLELRSGGSVTIVASGTITLQGADIVLRGAVIKEN